MNKSKRIKISPTDGGGPAVLESRPAFTPDRSHEQAPDALVQAETAAPPTAAIWQRNQRVNGLWSKSEDRNSWVAIRGIGWKKLANTSDSGNVALALLSSQALETGRPVDYREEADGMLHEIYLW